MCNEQHSHKLLSFSFYVTRSRTKRIQNSSAHLYFSSSSAFAFSPPCGSCSVFEVAHTVYKNTLKECLFIRLRAKHAKHQADNLAKLRQEFFVHARIDSKDFLRGRNCENKRGQWQPPLWLRFYLGDSHVALLLGMTFESVAIT